MQPSTLSKRAWFVLFFALIAFYLYGLGSVPLIGPDEPRYAEVAREMLARHDVITPTLGNMPWFEKPPLLYWLMIASYLVFGVNEFAARLGPALCGLATAAFVYWIASTIFTRDPAGEPPRTASEQDGPISTNLAQWSALALLSSIGVIVFSRAASFDIVVTMTLTGSLAFFFVWTVRTARPVSAAAAAPGRNNILLAGFYSFIGFSLLAKGLIGIIIPFAVVGFYFLMRRERPPRAFLGSLLWGIPLAIGVAAVWYGPMLARHGKTFVDQFIVQHHLARFLTNKYHHPEPFYFFPVTLTWIVLPWTVFLFAAFLSSRSWNWRGSSALDRLRVFCFAWIVVPLVFFSFSESKLAAYILPVAPAAALLVGERINCFLRAERGEKVIRLTGGLLLVLSAAGAWVGIRHMEARQVCVISVTFAPVLTGTAALLMPRMRRLLILAFAFSTFAASGAALLCIAPAIAERESVRGLLNVAAERGYSSTPIVQLFTAERTAEFYGAGRLTYRPDGEPKMLEGVTEVADAARRNGGIVLCLVPGENEAQLLDFREVQSEELANNGRVALFIVRVR